MKATFRLSVLVLSLVLAALPGALRDSGPAVAEESGQLVVLDWPGYDAEAFWIDFKKKYPDARVNFEIGASDADIYGKIKAGSQADIIHPYTGWLQGYVDEGLVEEIDVTKIPNWDKVPENLKKIGNFNGKQYFIPWDWGFSSVLYRTDKVKGPIDSWSALFDPQYNRHISMYDDGPSAVGVSAYLNKYNEHNITPDQLAAIKEEWGKQRDLNLVYWAGEPELVDAMAVGDVWVAYAWQGAYATLVKKGVPVVYANPKEGRASWVGAYGIRKGTKNKELALKFINEKLSEATANNVVTEFNYGAANGEVMNNISDPALKKAFSLDDPSVLQRTNFTPELTAEQRDAWTSMWTDVKAAP